MIFFPQYAADERRLIRVLGFFFVESFPGRCQGIPQLSD